MKQLNVRSFLDRNAGLILSIPALFILFLMVIVPFVMALVTSFTNLSVKSLLNPNHLQITGVSNYASLLTDRAFLTAIQNTFFFTVLVVPLQTGLALLFAVIVKGTALWQKVLKTSFFLPVITSMAVLSVVWTLLLNPSIGPINTILSLLSIEPQPFLTHKSQAMLCIITMSIWQGAGFQMMVFLAGMQAIPKQLYEAAAIEHSSPWQNFRYVTFPLLRNTTIFVILITTIFAFKLFIQPHLITQGGPQNATMTIILQLYNQAFVNGSYGKASAISILFFVIVLTVSLVQRNLLPKEIKS